MKRQLILGFLVLVGPTLAIAQYAPEGKVRCAYNVALKDKDACIAAAKTFNAMSVEQKRSYNQRIKEQDEKADRERTIAELQEINRNLKRQNY